MSSVWAATLDDNVEQPTVVAMFSTYAKAVAYAEANGPCYVLERWELDAEEEQP